MSDAERKELEQEEWLLKMLLDFYVSHTDEISMADDEREQHINAMLERIWEIKERLKN